MKFPPLRVVAREAVIMAIFVAASYAAGELARWCALWLN